MNNLTQQIQSARQAMPLAERRARGQAGQSVVVAIIVLFLLLFLGGIFIGIVAGNIKNSQRAAVTSAAGRFAEAGIRYLDEQLTKSPQGADWRPAPDCVWGTLPCANVGIEDPDYRWLRPCGDADGNGVNDEEPCGFSRVAFGSDVGGGPDRGPSVGGRALVRITYAPNSADPLSRYIKLEAVGRVGQIIPNDPTTYTNSEAIGQRVEQIAYKAIGLNEYVRQVTNKENRPVNATLGAPFPVRDRGALRPVENVIDGPIRVNAGLTFYGINRLILNPLYNEALEVAGPIRLNGVGDSVTTLSGADPTQVYIYVQNGAAIAPLTTLAAGSPSVFPSGSPVFTTLGPELAALVGAEQAIALVRDNPRGNEVLGLAPEVDTQGNPYQQFRSVGRQEPPVIDAETGTNGLTRYRALTRNAPPLEPRYTTANPVAAALANNDTAGVYGWGQGMYIGNTADVQNNSENLLGGYSLRGDWLNPPDSPATNSGDIARWRGDFEYVPEGVIITLYPAYFTVEVSAHDGLNGQRRQFFFRRPDGADAGGRLRDMRKILRYTRVQNPPNGGNSLDANGEPLGIGTGVATADAKLEGYPAEPVTANGATYYEGEFVIFAEGNIRIRGVVGGEDPETGAYFKRHLTVVSNANIYIDGNLLRDNIPTTDNSAAAAMVRGQSTIALLAKNYIAVNTTQFMSPQQAVFQTEANNNDKPYPRKVSPTSLFAFRSTFGPAQLDPTAGFPVPPYLEPGAPLTPAIFLRHASAGVAQSGGEGATNINLFVNEVPNGTPPVANNGAPLPNKIDFNGPAFTGDTVYNYTYSDPFTRDPYALELAGRAPNAETPGYQSHRFDIPLAYFFPGNPYPYNPAPPVLGQDNFMALNVDASLPSTTADYLVTRAGVAPADIRIEALMYAQEGSFFIIPGPWFNPNPNDTYASFLLEGHRPGEAVAGTAPPRIHPFYPFYQEPMDIRITFCGAISENLTAEIADQGAWLEKWGWIPAFYGSTGLTEAQGYPEMGGEIQTLHGPNGALAKTQPALPGTGGNGIVYEFDRRALAPYAPAYSGMAGQPLRRNPYHPQQPLPFAPRLPVAPGLLYYGQNTIQP